MWLSVRKQCEVGLVPSFFPCMQRNTPAKSLWDLTWSLPHIHSHLVWLWGDLCFKQALHKVSSHLNRSMIPCVKTTLSKQKTKKVKFQKATWEYSSVAWFFWWCFPSLWFLLLCGFCILLASQPHCVCTTSAKQQKAADFALLQAFCSLSPKSWSNLPTYYLLNSPALWWGWDKAPLRLEKERQEEVVLRTGPSCALRKCRGARCPLTPLWKWPTAVWDVCVKANWVPAGTEQHAQPAQPPDERVRVPLGPARPCWAATQGNGGTAGPGPAGRRCQGLPAHVAAAGSRPRPRPWWPHPAALLWAVSQEGQPDTVRRRQAQAPRHCAPSAPPRSSSSLLKWWCGLRRVSGDTGSCGRRGPWSVPRAKVPDVLQWSIMSPEPR